MFRRDSFPASGSDTRHLDDPRTLGRERPATVVFGQLEDGATGTIRVSTSDVTRTVQAQEGMFLLVLDAVPLNHTITVEMPDADGGVETTRL